MVRDDLLAGEKFGQHPASMFPAGYVRQIMSAESAFKPGPSTWPARPQNLREARGEPHPDHLPGLWGACRQGLPKQAQREAAAVFTRSGSIELRVLTNSPDAKVYFDRSQLEQVPCLSAGKKLFLFAIALFFLFPGFVAATFGEAGHESTAASSGGSESLSSRTIQSPLTSSSCA